MTKTNKQTNRKNKTTWPHFSISFHLCQQLLVHAHKLKSVRTGRPLLIFLTHTCGCSCTFACEIHIEAHMQCTNTKQMSSQSRWAPFCVESKASAKPVALGRGGVHQPAEAPAWCPRVARVTLGLLPSHCRDQKGPLLSSGRWQQWG